MQPRSKQLLPSSPPWFLNGPVNALGKHTIWHCSQSGSHPMSGFMWNASVSFPESHATPPGHGSPGFHVPTEMEGMSAALPDEPPENMLLIHPAHETLSGEAAAVETLLSDASRGCSDASDLWRRTDEGCDVRCVASVVTHSTVAITATVARRRA